MNGRIFEVWLRQLSEPNCDEITAGDSELLRVGVLQNVGTPEEPASAKHLHGLVAEQLWIDLIGEQDLGLGPPIRVEGHDWSVTDPGGDGLTVHEVEARTFCFRLWESKYHGTSGPIRDTVGTACRQVKSRVLSYLTRFSFIAQHLEDNILLSRFYARLPEMWVDKDNAAGVSIVVGASSADGEEGCFGVIPEHFDLGPDRHQGELNTVGDFVGFAERVRELLWKGCGLWSAP
jgi:hypothetical protein